MEGQVVELREVRDVSTVLTRLADMATEAKTQGKTAPTYDLCLLLVARFDLDPLYIFVGGRFEWTKP